MPTHPQDKQLESKDDRLTLDIIGHPWSEAKYLLEVNQIRYALEWTRPNRDSFPLDELRPYVIRQKLTHDGQLLVTVAAGPRREVS